MQTLEIKTNGQKLAVFAVGGCVLWLVLTLIFSVSGYIDASRLGQYSPFTKHFIDTGIGFIIWGFIGPVLFAVAGSDGFVEGHWSKKLLYFTLSALFAFTVMMIFVIFVVAPYWGYDPLDFLKIQRVVQWLGDMFLFVIVILLGYAAAVVQKAQQAALAAAQLQSTLAQEQAEKSAFEATYLRGRLGSHFVMNALSNVLGLVRLGDTARAEDATILLSDILRGMTSEDTGNLVSLSTEVALAEKYLAFQHIRYPSLTSSFDVEPNTMQAWVPGQLLQPLLENVFKHARLPKVATLTVAVHTDDDRLHITVTNNSTAASADTTSEGEGLTLTALRIKSLMKGRVAVARTYADGLYVVALDLPLVNSNEGAQ